MHHTEESSTKSEQAQKLVEVEEKLRAIGDRQRKRQAEKTLWLSHHWPDQYEDRCIKVGSSHVCRRCASLYPLGFAVAFAAAFGRPIWPDSWDLTAIWLVALPGTIAYIGEALGLFRYSPRWQVGATLVTALAFGKGLSYELQERWSVEFWLPLTVFGFIWLSATLYAQTNKSKI